MYLANGSQEYCAFWIDQNVKYTFKVTLNNGADLKVRRLFVPVVAGQASDIDEEEIMINGPGETHAGTFARDVAGVLWLSVDNSASWWNAKTFSLTFNDSDVGLSKPLDPLGKMLPDNVAQSLADLAQSEQQRP